MLVEPWDMQPVNVPVISQNERKIFNKSSKVIMARIDGQTVITMLNDFKGHSKDFAMIVPVPELIERNQIRIPKEEIFDKLEAFTAPRAMEQRDLNPCESYAIATGTRIFDDSEMIESVPTTNSATSVGVPQDFTVTVHKEYTVGEYDIVILSAEQSNGLKDWLKLNKYKIPSNAEEVLDPYVKQGMKFFIAKVSLDNVAGSGFQTLSPLQLTFRSDKFMLPIRLGMANSDGNDQDLIVYTLTERGRVETANYRTVNIASELAVPTFVKSAFERFYEDVFETTWEKEGKNVGVLEFGWNISDNSPVKCDPCVAALPTYHDLREAGAFWVGEHPNAFTGNLYLTRLHFRYNRQTFPQDLEFIETPNKVNFQSRYHYRIPAQGGLACDEAQFYLQELVQYRQQELNNLASAANWDLAPYKDYVQSYKNQLKRTGHMDFLDRLPPKEERDRGGFFLWLPQFPQGMLPFTLLVLGIMSLFLLHNRIYGNRHLRTYP